MDINYLNSSTILHSENILKIPFCTKVMCFFSPQNVDIHVSNENKYVWIMKVMQTDLKVPPLPPPMATYKHT